MENDLVTKAKMLASNIMYLKEVLNEDDLDAIDTILCEALTRIGREMNDQGVLG